MLSVNGQLKLLVNSEKVDIITTMISTSIPCMLSVNGQLKLLVNSEMVEKYLMWYEEIACSR